MKLIKPSLHRNEGRRHNIRFREGALKKYRLPAEMPGYCFSVKMWLALFILWVLPAACFSVEQEKLLYSDTYLSTEVPSGNELPAIEEQVYSTPDGILFTRRKIQKHNEKSFRCLFDKKSNEIQWAYLERQNNGSVYQRINVKQVNDEVVFHVEGKNARTKTIKLNKDKFFSVPDALHFSLGSWQLKKGEKRDLDLIDWNGKTLLFHVEGKGIKKDANNVSYREVYLKPELPLFARTFISWSNTYWFALNEPYRMMLFKGKQGPFSPEIVIWLKSAGKPDIKN